jgi:glycosyltransferase involved in cell wall biosynthesis
MIDVLLATYNGEKFVGQQIESVINQTYTDWKLIIRDDNSSDNTPKIIKEYAAKHPDKIKVLDNGKNNLGVVKNFGELLKASNSDYVCFCDQDDVWFPFKLERTLKMMLENQKRNPGKAVLVHSDMVVVDDSLNKINDSFFKYQNINPKIKKLSRLLVQNNVTGCSTMINKELKKAILPFKEGVVMHDWYAALVASSIGVIDHIPYATSMYRQHSDNQLGAVKYDGCYIINKLVSIFEKISLINGQKQASLINDLVAKVYSTLNDQNWFKRRYYMFKFGFYKKGFLRNLGLFLKI